MSLALLPPPPGVLHPLAYIFCLTRARSGFLPAELNLGRTLHCKELWVLKFPFVPTLLFKSSVNVIAVDAYYI